MIFLLLAVLCSVLIGNLLVIFTKEKNNDILIIFLGNYFVASLFSLGTTLPKGFSLNGFDIWFGVLTGLLFLSNFMAYQKNIRINGLSLSVGTMRVSVIIPALVAVFFFADRMSFVNIAGIVIIITAFGHVTDTKALRNLLWLLFLFLVSGMTESTLKIYSELGSSNQNPFLFVIFTSAGLFTLLWILAEKRQFHLNSLLYGFALGIPNQLSSLFFLKGLKTIPATIAYPLYASGIVIISILCDIFIWKKFFTAKQRLALALLIVGVVLVSLSK